MIILLILIASLIHFSLEGWETVLFELESERVKLQKNKQTNKQKACRVGTTAAHVRPAHLAGTPSFPALPSSAAVESCLQTYRQRHYG